MRRYFIGLVVLLIAVNVRAAEGVSLTTQATHPADTNAPAGTNGVADDPDRVEYETLMQHDQDAMDEVDGWIKVNNEAQAKGGGLTRGELNQKILKRMGLLRAEYEDFIKRHPNHADVRIAFASFLEETGDDDAQIEQLEKARELNPKNPAVWNQLANFYGHNSPVTNAFADYTKAIELNSNEPVYYQNLATTVFLYRTDARAYYHINEQQVFDKAMGLYDQAMKLDPTNFVLACDVATSYYGIRPWRMEAALRAWTNALTVANDEIEREGVYIHLARLKIIAGNFNQAHAHLDAVTNETYANIKRIVSRNLDEKEHPSETNAPPGVTNPPHTQSSAPGTNSVEVK